MARKTTQQVVHWGLLDYILKKLHCSKSQFANMISVSAATITKWLYTDTKPDTHVVQRMSRRLGLSIEEVLALFDE